MGYIRQPPGVYLRQKAGGGQALCSQNLSTFTFIFPLETNKNMEHFFSFSFLHSNFDFFSNLRCLRNHLSKLLWRFFCIVAFGFSFQTALQFFVRLCDSSPPALHFIVLNSYKSASLTCQPWSFATFHIKGDICKRARSNTILVDLLSFITSITTDIYHTSERKTRV